MNPRTTREVNRRATLRELAGYLILREGKTWTDADTAHVLAVVQEIEALALKLRPPRERTEREVNRILEQMGV